LLLTIDSAVLTLTPSASAFAGAGKYTEYRVAATNHDATFMSALKKK
jgi:hypothetical protein